MSWKKFFCGAAAAAIVFSASMFCPVSAEESANAKLARIEIDTYGAEQSGAILDRISRLEKSYSGQNMNGTMNARIEAIYDILYDNSADVGILAKINLLEWNVNHLVAGGGIDNRLAALENQITGKPSEGTINDRIRQLTKAIYGEEIMPITQVQIPANTLIKVATTAPVNAKVLQEGDSVPVKVIEDVFVDNSLVFASGLPGEGVVMNIRRARNIFTNGKIEIDFNVIKSFDGQDVKTFTGVESVEAMNNNSMARGLSLIGQTFSGKNKEIEEVFIRGKNIDLPEGIELYVQIKEPVVVYGLRKSGGYVDTATTPATPEQTVAPAPVETLTREEFELVPPEESTVSPPTEVEIVIDESEPAPPAPSEVEVVVDESEPAPPNSPEVEPRREEGKTLEGYDGEIIEIVDEE